MQQGFSGVLLLFLVLLLAVGGFGGYFFYNQQKLNSINSFEDCAKHFPVMESFPEQCNTPDGKHFVREMPEEEKQGLLSPLEPSPATLVKEGWSVFQGNVSANQNSDAQFSVQYPSEWELDDSINGTGIVYPLGKGEDKPRIVLGAGGHGWYPDLSSSKKDYEFGTASYSWGKPAKINYYVGYISFHKKYSFIIEASYIPVESESQYKKIFEEIGSTLQIQ